MNKKQEMTQINLMEQIYPLNGDHRIQTVKPRLLTLEWVKSIDRQCKHSATNITGIKYGIVQDCTRVLSSLPTDQKPWNSITIDVTIGGVFDYAGPKDFKICPFLSLYHDKGA